MSGEFLRLYRKIGDGKDSSFGDRYQSSALAERLLVLNTLGYQTGFNDHLTKPLKYHGRAARRRKHPIPVISIPQIHMKASKETRSTLQSSSSTSFEAIHLISLPKPSKTCVVKYMANNSLSKESNSKNKSVSSNKWTILERDKLVEMYLSLKAPLCAELMAGFYDEVAARFRVFYPLRTRVEVTLKMREMLLNNAMKSPGEVAYWKARER